jgi:UPF0755 protein
VKKLGLVALALLLVALGVAGFFWLRDRKLTQFSRSPYGSPEPKLVDIPTGTGPHALAELLARHAVIASADLFYAYLRRDKLAPRMKAGEYEFTGPLTPAEVAEKIASGQVKVYRFTVPEGLRVEEALPILTQSELHLDGAKLAALSEDERFLRKLGVPAPSAEGFLFPDTYSFTRGYGEEAVLAKMVSRSLDEYRNADAERKKGITLDLLQTMTLASIIEKETAAPEERPRISCVFHNRLRLRMRLGTDPTVLYAMRLIRGRWVNNITASDLRTEHPYNTYMVYGLPPGPIASAGAASIHAALNPLDCSDLYFVSRNNGTHEFCPDLKCHNAAVDHWQKEYFKKQKHGG